MPTGQDRGGEATRHSPGPPRRPLYVPLSPGHREPRASVRFPQAGLPALQLPSQRGSNLLSLQGSSAPPKAHDFLCPQVLRAKDPTAQVEVDAPLAPHLRKNQLPPPLPTFPGGCNFRFPRALSPFPFACHWQSPRRLLTEPQQPS